MANSFGGSVKLSGENEYKSALKQITAELKVMSSEMQVVSATYNKNDSSVESLTSKNQVLNKQIEAQTNKIDILKAALENSKKEYGDTSTKTLEYQNRLNKAEAELINMNNQVDANTEGIKNFGKETDSAGKKVLSMGDIIKANIISEAIIGGIKAMANVMKEIGSVIVDVSKDAINNYAEYEQLVGGVETLFGQSSNIVQEYANNAYKTAGLSANQYMDTVTSFSASLLQSLNGDTAKSAEIADMAITDMSDNANKMGTSMDSIQAAYQGFAKQNYTMLDNLKLGYGGTKTEMERLLTDATKLSGVKYDINNLNEVYEAIHVVQTELGITGTTAKEADQTISGATTSMKTSWTNLLTGLADGNADIETLVSNVVDSALTVADNILPIIEQVASSVLKVLPTLLNNIISNLPRFLESGSNILNSLISGLKSNMPAIMDAVMQILNMFIQTLVQNLPMIIEMGIQMLVSLIQGIAETLPTLIPTIIDAVILIVETLLDNLDLIIDAGIKILFGLIDGIIIAMPKLIDKIPEIIDKLIIAITNNLPKLIQAGINLNIKLAEGLIKAIPQLVSKIPQIITSLVNGLKEGIGKMAEVGLNLVQGLWNGINNAKDWVLDKIKGFGKSILNGIKSFFGIHSPSRVFRDEVGLNLALGVGEGFTEGMDDVIGDMQNSIPTDFDMGVNAALNTDLATTLSNAKISSTNDDLIYSLQNALKGMSFMVDGDKMGELVINHVEKVVYA